MSRLALAAAMIATVLLPGMAQAGQFHLGQQQNLTMSASQGNSQADTKSFCVAGMGHGHCQPPRPGHTQPTCLGPHKGPNGVMIQCE